MRSVRDDLPSGTVTFLFTDVEGSTRLLRELGVDQYAHALSEHRRVLRAAFAAHGGVEVDTQGDAFFAVFPTAPGALAAAAQAVEGLAPGPIRVRMGLHTGTPHLAEEGYVGVDVHRAARIAACGHGGQVLVSASTASLIDADDLRDQGEHRLKDLSAPERVYQLGADEFPPLKSLHQTNLPFTSTPFLGRERELAEVSGLITRADVRLLTLSGPGGTGKTRLALQAAVPAADAFAGGVWWVPLAALRDPTLVLETAGQAIGAKGELADHIADKSLLLLLDNFEQVVPAAEDLAHLLAACPNLRMLVTSRELLAIPGEQSYDVPPLEPQEGATLFLERARAADPHFVASAAVPLVCARLDNLPLALELAAARVRLLSPEQLLERLSHRLDVLRAGRGVDQRQQTLRATIEWSHDLLDPDERELFARLAVFTGGSRSTRQRSRPTRTSTPCRHFSTRASCAGATAPMSRASGCSRRSGSTPSNGWRAGTTPIDGAGGTRTTLSPSRSEPSPASRVPATWSGRSASRSTWQISAPRSPGPCERARQSGVYGWQGLSRRSGTSEAAFARAVNGCLTHSTPVARIALA